MKRYCFFVAHFFGTFWPQRWQLVGFLLAKKFIACEARWLWGLPQWTDLLLRRFRTANLSTGRFRTRCQLWLRSKDCIIKYVKRAHTQNIFQNPSYMFDPSYMYIRNHARLFLIVFVALDINTCYVLLWKITASHCSPQSHPHQKNTRAFVDSLRGTGADDSGRWVEDVAFWLKNPWI